MQTNKIQLLAAYEAAIGPALKSIVVIPDARAADSQKRKAKSPASKPLPSSSRHRLPNGPKPPRSVPSGGAGAKLQPQQPQLQPNPTSSFSSPTPHYHLLQQQQQQQQQRQQSETQEAADLERLERQALRRRKVEALESLSHTAALFLAEFMTFTKRQNSSTLSAEDANCEHGGGRAPAPNDGMEYAAAAAGMAVCLLFS